MLPLFIALPARSADYGLPAESLGNIFEIGGEAVIVSRRVKDFIEISDYTSLDALIRYLQTIRASLPKDCEPELKMRGDDVFGRRLTISFMRELTPDEAALEARYTPTEVPPENPELERLRARLDVVPYDDHASGI